MDSMGWPEWASWITVGLGLPQRGQEGGVLGIVLD